MSDTSPTIRFELDRLESYNDAAIIEEIRRVAAIVPHGELTRRAFDSHSRVASSTVVRRFAGWRPALAAAGIEDRYAGRVVSEKMRSQAARSLGDEELLHEIRRVADDLGTRVLTMEALSRNSGIINAKVVKERFGSWRAALEKAGLELSSLGRRYTEGDYFENLLAVWTHYGRAPTYAEMERPPSKITSGAYEKKWGTWTRAKAAFVARVNADVGAPVQSDPPECRPNPGPLEAAARPKLPPDAQHVIRLGLRYAVLSRDRFRCTVCGASPAKDLACELHVDHIVPFSKGGLTVLSNLRTLCSRCNIGKGNRTAAP